MILAALTEEFRSLFGRHAEARIALWFDEKWEFERLLPALDAHLSSLKTPPFTLLRYDEQAGHGQLWMKYQIHWATRDLPPLEREARRYVLYLPFPAERLDGPEEDGGFSADFLLEYRYLGATWLVDGKKPTLFAFLRRAGVDLPADPREQRLLWEGGRDSLLAKFTARFADRDARFWRHALTPAWARQQVVGDVEQTILDLAEERAQRLTELIREGLLPEFVQQVRDAFGYARPLAAPQGAGGPEDDGAVDEWLKDLVARLALTETYEAYGESVDFPFATVLPEPPYRARCVQFLRRWLRDGSAAPDYHRLVRSVEREYDLSGWAKDRSGISYAFPHLARLRFRHLYDEFRDAAKQKSVYVPFLHRHAEALAAEAEVARTSPEPVRGFELLHRLAQLVAASEEAMDRLRACTTAEELLALYLGYAGRVDRDHWRLVADGTREDDLEDLVAVANRAYGEYLTRLNTAFFESIHGLHMWGLGGLSPIAEVAARVWNGRRPFAVVIVDALRYDCALEIRERLGLPEPALQPALACLPTRTWAGMTALLPLRPEDLRYEPGPGEGRLRGVGMAGAFSDRQTRLAYLRERVSATCMEIDEAEGIARAPRPLPPVLCVFGHETIDSLGHDKASDLVRHLHIEVERLVNLVGKLHRWGYPEVHLLTDHGFVMTSEDVDPPIVPIPADRALVVKGRYAILPEGALVDAKSFPLALDPRFRVAVPPGMACFKAERSFAHGGAAVQEVVIPHLVSRKEAAPQRVGVRVVPAAYEVKTHAVKLVLEPVPPEVADLFIPPVGRTVEADLRRGDTSVLARPVRREIPAQGGEKVTVVLMLDDRLAFPQGDLLDVVVRDIDNQELLSPAGLRLTVARDL